MNSLLLTLTALFILVLSALFAAPLFIDWNDYRPAFEEQATKLLGREVKVGGKVHLVLLPTPQLKFDDVKVAGEDGRLDRPFLEAKSFEAKLDIGTLLTGTVEAHQLAIVDPVLRLEIKADGTGNWGDVGRPGVPVPFTPKDVLLDAVRVSGGTVEIVKDGATKFVISNIDGEASAASLSGPYKVSAEYDFDGRRQELRFSTGAMDEAGQFRLKAALRDPGRSTTYQLDGGVTGLGGKPAYDGTILMRVTNLAAAAPVAPEDAAPVEAQMPEAQDPEAQGPEAQDAEAGPPTDDLPTPQEMTAQEEITPAAPDAPGGPRDTASFVELKGRLKATSDRAELPEFDLTVHAKGRPQILKGSLALDFGQQFKADGRLSARWIDLDALFGAQAEGKKPSPAAVLYMFADWVLDEAEAIGEGALALDIEQASLGGDLVGNLDMELATRDGGVTLERLKAVLPGGNRIAVSGRLQQGAMGPLFTGPIEIEGEDLRALTRWAAGDRGMTGHTSVGDFSLSAFATIGDGELKLADALGEVSGTKFRGRLHYQGGRRNVIEVDLDSDRLDLREMLGDGPFWRSWLSAGGDGEAAPDSTGPSLLTQLGEDDVQATFAIGELLLPNIPPGKLDARLALVDGTLDIEQLDFLAPGAIALNGKGRITSVAAAPAGRVDVTLQAQTTDALRVVSELFGLPENVTKSKHLSALAPLDIHAGLVAGPAGDATKASLELSGKVGGSDMALVARAKGEPAKLAEAEIDIGGSVTGERPQALLVLLFPDLPQDRLAAAAGAQGTLSVKLAGVPATKLAGRAVLETAAMQLSFEGHGALKEQGVALNGHGSVATEDASLALPLIGLDAPPSAVGVPFSLSANVVKEAGTVDLDGIEAKIAGDKIDGSAHFELGGGTTRFNITADADRVSLPAVLGVLVAWERTASTQDMLGAVGADAAEVWPARGFALDTIDTTEGDVTLKAKTLVLGAPFQVADATLNARIDDKGLTITDLKGALFGGALTAFGMLSPHGGGAGLTATADLKGAQLEALTESVAGRSLAKGPFDVAFAVQGEGLSPPGVVAGLSGKGTLSLGAGMLQALNPEPLRRVAAAAAKTKIKATKEEVAADTRKVRETLPTGTYKYAPAQFAFDVKNGTLRLSPEKLVTSGAETDVNAYLELASLKLDSEWQMRLTGPGSKDVPPVTVVFAGPLDQADQIAPAVDTAAIESYLTIRRMQEDVERLETLDVSGRNAPQDDAGAQAAAEAEAKAAEAAEAEAARAAEENTAADRAAAEAEAAAAQAVAERAAREQAEAQAKAEAEAKAQAEAQAQAEAEAQAKALAAAEAKAQAEAKALAEARAAAAAQAAAEQAALEKAAAARAAKAKAQAEAKAAAARAAKDKAQAEANAKAEAKAAAVAKAAAEQAAKERAAAEAKAATEQAAREKIEAEAKAAAAKAAQATAAAARAAKERAAAEASARAAAVPSALLPPSETQLSPGGEAVDPIGEMISADPGADPATADPATAETDPDAAEAESAEEVPPEAPRRYRRKRAAPDDWKKGYSIFGGG